MTEKGRAERKEEMKGGGGGRAERGTGEEVHEGKGPGERGLLDVLSAS